MTRTRRRIGIAVGSVVAVLAIVAAIGFQTGLTSTAIAWWDNRNNEFPAIDTTDLTPAQKAILAVTRTEFDAQPDGTKYAEGVEEQWCADFVSWVMRESGVPLANPHSGHWRIPGVYTLTEFFQAQGRFAEPGSSYRPKLGDVMLYNTDSHFRQHTNIVLAYDGHTVTTVGGNEWGGHITVSRFTPADDDGLVGYGVL